MECEVSIELWPLYYRGREHPIRDRVDLEVHVGHGRENFYH
jgi:hypothetical protein